VKRVAQYCLAFGITIAIKGAYMGLLLTFAASGMSGNRVSLDAHEHNAAARDALNALHIPNLHITESHISSVSPFGVSFLLAISEVGSTIGIFFCALWFVRLMSGQRE
jgi:hypothetical protein